MRFDHFWYFRVWSCLLFGCGHLLLVLVSAYLVWVDSADHGLNVHFFVNSVLVALEVNILTAWATLSSAVWWLGDRFCSSRKLFTIIHTILHLSILRPQIIQRWPLRYRFSKLLILIILEAISNIIIAQSWESSGTAETRWIILGQSFVIKVYLLINNLITGIWIVATANRWILLLKLCFLCLILASSECWGWSTCCFLQVDRVGRGVWIVAYHDGIGPGSHVLQGVVGRWEATCVLLGCGLVHVYTNVLLPILTRRSTILSLIIESKASSLIWGCKPCRATRQGLLNRRLGSTTSRTAGLSAVITLSCIVACAHIS